MAFACMKSGCWVPSKLENDNRVNESVGWNYWRGLAVKIYWFNDTGLGTCQVSENRWILCKEQRHWSPISNQNAYTDHKDQYNITEYDPVKMEAIRLEV